MTKSKLEPCPICGGASGIIHMAADGFDMGYSAGCMRFRLCDGIHGMDFDTLEEEFPSVEHWDKATCVRMWNAKAKRLKEAMLRDERQS